MIVLKDLIIECVCGKLVLRGTAIHDDIKYNPFPFFAEVNESIEKTLLQVRKNILNMNTNEVADK